MNAPRFGWPIWVFLGLAVAQCLPEATAASAKLILSNHTRSDSMLAREELVEQVIDTRQLDLYELCINSADRAERSAHAIMPSRFWAFDGATYERHLDRLHRASSTLSENQRAFEDSLTPQQVVKFSSELQGIQLLESKMELCISDLDSALRNHQAVRWRVSQNSGA